MGDKTAQPLPRLNAAIELNPAPPRADGSPSWTLYHPVSDKHYRIDWAEFECLARFGDHTSKSSLIKAVNDQTTLDIDENDVNSLIEFLEHNGLLALDSETIHIQTEQPKPIWKRLLHGYLYFTIPVIRPQQFLQDSLPYVRPLLGRSFITMMMVLLVIGIVMTIARADEFFNSLPVLASVQGIIGGLVIFALIKVFHELAHAYTATAYGVRVPHMGVALIILYPVLYTETSGAWRLSSRRQRFHIGMAGIVAELCIAALAFIAWHAAAAGGIVQGLSLTVIAVSLVSSLLINLNPLMRFDGYYLLSDMTGEDNLQQRACAFARWTLRRFLFADNTPAPESLSVKRQRFLTIFGIALLIYRFFLFIGIAVLIYWMVPKPLGAILAAIELYWFIALPIISELKIWWQKRDIYRQTRRSRITVGAMVAVIILTVIPFPRTIVVPAVLHAAAYQDIYPPVEASIQTLQVENGDRVEKGDVLATLSSVSLDKDIALQTAKLESLEQSRAGLSAMTSGDISRYNAVTADIALTRRILENLEKQADRLTITAPFSGHVRDLSPYIQQGRQVRTDDFLFRLVSPDRHVITAYIDDHKRSRLIDASEAEFIPRHSPFQTVKAHISGIDETNSTRLPWLSLSSEFGGEIPTKTTEITQEPIMIQSRYAIRAAIHAPEHTKRSDHAVSVQQGHMHIRGAATSLLGDSLERVIAVFIREFGLN